MSEFPTLRVNTASMLKIESIKLIIMIRRPMSLFDDNWLSFTQYVENVINIINKSAFVACLNKPFEALLLPTSCWFLTWLNLQPCRWRRHIPPKLWLTFSGLHIVICKMLEFSVTNCDNHKSYLNYKIVIPFWTFLKERKWAYELTEIYPSL
jgi:hypothetical protein